MFSKYFPGFLSISFAISTFLSTAAFYFLFFADRRPTERDGLWAGAPGRPSGQEPGHPFYLHSRPPFLLQFLFFFFHLKRGRPVMDGTTGIFIVREGRGGMMYVVIGWLIREKLYLFLNNFLWLRGTQLGIE